MYRMPDAKRRRKIPRRKIPKKVGVVGATAATPAAAPAATRGEVPAGAGVLSGGHHGRRCRGINPLTEDCWWTSTEGRHYC